MVQTTCIGAWPKPVSLGGGDWQEIKTGDADASDSDVQGFSYTTGAARKFDDEVLNQATAEAVQDQVACGIDVPTDGEMRRENYIHYHCRHLNGIDFDLLTSKIHRNGAAIANLPTITNKVEPKGNHFLDRDFAIAQAATDRPVKITIPGPLTIIDTTANAAYENERDLAMDLAVALNFEIRALVAAGCQYIQVDEPVFARRVDDALDFGVESLARCFEDVPSSVTRVMHMCCGYPGHLDDQDYPKADVDSYFKLARQLDDCCVDQVSLEHAHRANDLSLLELFQKTSVILGAIDVARSGIEPVEEVRLLLEKALRHINVDRLIAAPDCGLILLDRDTAMAKLRNMCAAAKSF
jgi:5-methyltetrahydropteroyltriglutamate--homocysteine methyltransferase